MKKLLLLFVLYLNIAYAHGQHCAVKDVKSGDLVFVSAVRENLSAAINRVTQNHQRTSYDHIGIVELIGDSLFVMHASGKKGSFKETLVDFQGQLKPEQQLSIYRLKPLYQKAIPEALAQANSMLGKPYNWSYILNDTSFYCSDFIERAFRKNKIFALEPMTFINPQNNKLDDFWLSYYQKMNVNVPEGQLGCNPNGLAASDKLHFVGLLY